MRPYFHISYRDVLKGFWVVHERTFTFSHVDPKVKHVSRPVTPHSHGQFYADKGALPVASYRAQWWTDPASTPLIATL